MRPAFLQGLLTNDVERLRPGEARYAALLSPQAKILFDMIVVREPDGDGAAYSLDCAAAQPATSPSGLASINCAPRSRSPTRAPIAPSSPSGAESPSTPPDGSSTPTRANPRLGLRAILPRADAAAIGSEHVDMYEGLRIGVGAPKGGVDFAYGDAFPHDANFDLLNGVDFDKGCYVGQEVVSRMKHRGTARKRIARVKTAGPAPPPGTPVLDRELAVGTLGSSSGREALALLRLDRVDDARAAGRTLSAGGVGVALAE